MSTEPRLRSPIDDVRIAFAGHFLDTETRPQLPLAALAAVEAGLSIEEAFFIWRFEVVPAVGHNMWNLFGEWAPWPEDWLVERIEKVRRRKSIWRCFLDAANCRLNRAPWRAIERCMRVLLEAPPAKRRALAMDLHSLARYYFDFAPQPFTYDGPRRLAELRETFREVFLPLFRRHLVPIAGEFSFIREYRIATALDSQLWDPEVACQRLLRHKAVLAMSVPEALVTEAARRYTEPHRAYHGPAHLLDVLDRFAEADEKGLWEKPREACLALLFHDAIYVPGAADNEERSALLALEECRRHAPEVDAARVAHLVRLTAFHGRSDVPLEGDEELLLDCDLAVLASSAYESYERGVRAEYAALSDEAFTARRRQFLKALLSSERLFRSSFFSSRLEELARENVNWSLRRIEEGR